MTPQIVVANMSFMRTMLIVATVAFGAAQLLWRAMRQGRQPAVATEWTADE